VDTGAPAGAPGGGADADAGTDSRNECFPVFECKLAVDKTCAVGNSNTFTDSCQVSAGGATVHYKSTVTNNSTGVGHGSRERTR
jgi:hypothetical protein